MDNNVVADYSQWERGKDYPEFFDDVAVKTISKGYLLVGEKPKDAYWRVATTIASRLRKPDLASKFFDYMWKGWLNLATPVFSNTGSERGLPISCFGIDVADSIHDIGLTNAELNAPYFLRGRRGYSLSRIRGRGAKITGNGTSDGVVPFCKIYDSTILATNQGNVRRGAASVNLDINHTDIQSLCKLEDLKVILIDNV